MTPVSIQLIVHYVIIIIWIKNSCGTRTEFDFPNYANESIGIKGDRNYGDKIDYSRQSSSDLPITFQAPVERTKSFWNYNPRINSFRKTFLDNSEYFNHDKSKIFPTFIDLVDFIRPLYDNISNPKSTKSKGSSSQTISEPYKYEYPFELHITAEENYLPPPKPIRASIIKLETVTRSPHFYEPLNYNTTPKYYQRFSNFQKNYSKTLNTLHIDELGFHSTSAINFRTEPSSSFKQISTEKKFTEPKWSYNFNRPDLNDAVTNKIITVIAEPHNISKENNTEKNILNVTTFNEIFSSIKNKEFPTAHNIDSEDSTAFLETESINLNSKYNAGLRSLTDNRKVKDVSSKTFEEVTTEIISKNCINSNRIINVERTRAHNYEIRDNNTRVTKISEMLRPYIKDNSIKTVTDLTIAGLYKSKEQSANIPIYTKYLNMSNLIRYELNKLKEENLSKATMNKFTGKAKSSFFTSANKISKIFGNDDFNLDLKILKDTNWDGFTTQIPEIFTTIRNTPTVIVNIKEPEADIKKYAIKQRKINNERTPLEIFKPSTDSVQNNSLKNGENSNNKSIIIETRISKSVTKATQMLHKVRSKKILLNNIEENKALSQMKSETGHNQNFEKNEGLKLVDFTKEGVVLRVNNKNETMKYNSSIYINDNAKLPSDMKTNNLFNSILTLTRKFNTSKESSQNDSKESSTLDNIKNRSRRRRKYKQKLKIKTQRKHENTFYNSSSINNSPTNRKILQKNVKALPINLDNTKNYSQKNGNYNMISENKSSEIMTQYDGKEYSEDGKPKSRKKLKKKRPAQSRRIVHSHMDDKSLK